MENLKFHLQMVLALKLALKSTILVRDGLVTSHCELPKCAHGCVAVQYFK